MSEKLELIKTEPFNIDFFPQIIDFVKPMWSFSEWEASFRKIYTETILRNNFFQNELTFQLAKNNKLLSAMFFQKKSEKNNLIKWVLDNSDNLTSKQKFSLNLCIEYLTFMDSKVHKHMKENDIKLSLFVGIEKGYGSILFEEVWIKIKKQNYKNMLLWTDCECNWEWYIKKGFDLIEESVYQKFNKATTEYKTYIFKKAIK